MHLKRRIIIILWFIVQLHSGFGQCYTITYKKETNFPDFAVAEFKAKNGQMPYTIYRLQTDDKGSAYKTIEFVPKTTYSLINEYVFKDKEKGITCKANLSYPDTLGTEFPSMTAADWDIMEDTMTIHGIKCRRAVLKNSDQNIIAYFAPEIPINDGPGEYCNLPGLIVKMYLPAHSEILTDIKYDKNCVIDQPKDFAIKYISNEKWEKHLNAVKNSFLDQRIKK